MRVFRLPPPEEIKDSLMFLRYPKLIFMLYKVLTTKVILITAVSSAHVLDDFICCEVVSNPTTVKEIVLCHILRNTIFAKLTRALEYGIGAIAFSPIFWMIFAP